MNQIRSLVAIARRRIRVSAFLEGAVAAALVLAIVALALVMVAKTSPRMSVPWTALLPAFLVLSAAAGTWWMRRQRAGELELAVAIDRRLGLKERFATALCCERRDDSFAQAAVEDAVRLAAEPALPGRVRDEFPIRAPRAWWAAPAVALIAGAALLLPQADLFATGRSQEEAAAAKQAATESIQKLVEEVAQDPALSKELADVIEDMKGIKLDGDTLRAPEEYKRDAIRKATELNQRLQELVEGEKGMTAEALREALRSMESPKEGVGKDLADALRNGDFKQANDKLQELLKDVQEGKLDAKQKEEAARQLEEVGKQLQQLAEQQKALEEALRKAGMDPQLAKNEKALQQALQNNQNLNQQQKQQLQQQAQAQQAACQACKGMGQSAMQMAQAMQGQSGQSGQQGQQGAGNQAMQQAAAQMGQMLTDAESMQQMLQQAQAAMQACQGQCQGQGEGMSKESAWAMLGQCQGQRPGATSQGMGGMGPNAGIGAGGVAQKAKTPTGTKTQREKVEVTGGDIIARQLVAGQQIVGEARKKLEGVVGPAAPGSEESVTEELVPPELKEAHKQYFGRLKQRIDKATQDTGAAPAAKPAQ